MLLGTFRSPELSPGGRLVERTAVRGALFRGRELLLLASRHGDYKFPGGGVEPGECSGGSPVGGQQLEGYEAELELTPQWVTVDEALAANQAVLNSGVGVMRWLVREIAVLTWLSARSR
ncbi:hypothetical protein AB0E63_25435 [Kribbella sp. NPDC026596]|uniref:hypothetical protein n=1 Tax=Kribbella sp. NPDC026596 TaxID=3155122 RepID=UPI0033FF47CE